MMGQKVKDNIFFILGFAGLFFLFLLSQHSKKRIENLFSKEENYIVVPAQVIELNSSRGNRSYTVRYKVGEEMIESRLYNTSGLSIGSTVFIRYLKIDIEEIDLADVPGNPKRMPIDSALLPKLMRKLYEDVTGDN